MIIIDILLKVNLVSKEVRHPALPSRKDLVPSYRQYGHRPPLHGLSQLQTAISPEAMPSPGGPTSGKKAQQGCIGQSFSLMRGAQMGHTCSRAPCQGRLCQP